MTDTGANVGAFYDTRFFDPTTLYNRSVTITGGYGRAPAKLYTYGTVHFILKGDRGDEVSITLKDQMYEPSAASNVIAAAALHAYGLATVVSPDNSQSGLWCGLNTPSAQKFANFIISDNGLPYLRPCAIGVSGIARRLAWLSNLKAKVPYAWAVSRVVAQVAVPSYVVCRVVAALLFACGGPAVGAPTVAICIVCGLKCLAVFLRYVWYFDSMIRGRSSLKASG